jgi:hypothetical protein
MRLCLRHVAVFVAARRRHGQTDPNKRRDGSKTPSDAGAKLGTRAGGRSPLLPDAIKESARVGLCAYLSQTLSRKEVELARTPLAYTSEHDSPSGNRLVARGQEGGGWKTAPRPRVERRNARAVVQHPVLSTTRTGGRNAESRGPETRPRRQLSCVLIPHDARPDARMQHR